MSEHEKQTFAWQIRIPGGHSGTGLCFSYAGALECIMGMLRLGAPPAASVVCDFALTPDDQAAVANALTEAKARWSARAEVCGTFGNTAQPDLRRLGIMPLWFSPDELRISVKD